MYGPLWIFFTIVVMLVVMSHLVRSLRAEIGFGESTEQDLADRLLIDSIVKRYGGAS